MPADPVLLSTMSDQGERSVALIAQWVHSRGGDAHCLARAHRAPELPRPLIVLSEIATNAHGRGIGDDLPVVAAAVLDALPPECAVDPAEVTWLTHHGDFSYPDALDAPEVFTLAPLRWDGHRYHDDLALHRRLRGEELRQTLGPIELRPVPEVLRRLGWPR